MSPTQHLSRSGHAYIAAVTLAGVTVAVHSLLVMISAPMQYQWFVLAGLTLLSGSFTVRIPGIPARLSVSETFVFAAVLLFGSAAATIIVLLDSLVILLWQGRRYSTQRVLFSAAAPAVAIWAASQVFYAVTGILPLSVTPIPVQSLVPGLITLAAAYFLFNSVLIAWAVAFETQLPTFSVWRQNFLWLSLNYFSGASVAALLLPYLYPEQVGFLRIIGILLPLLLISYLTFRTALGRVEDANRHLSELNRLYLSTIETLAMAIDAKDQITHGHIRRVQAYAVGLAHAMGVADELQIRAVEAAALLHDMGKLAVPEYILNKPGPLTPAEFDKMKVHASVGADILSAIDFPYPVVPIVRHHHECWDGSGYPDGLRGTDIPVGARILSVVDCFDALTSDRPYRPRLSDKDALRILTARRGTMYDPLVVDTFIRIHGDLAPSIDTSSLGSFVAITEAAASRHADAVTRTQPLDDIAASSEEMLTLFTLAKELTGRLSVADIGDVVLKHLRRIVPSSACVLYLYDEDTTDLVASHVTGEHAEIAHGLRIPLGERLSGWVGANRQSIRNSDPILDFGDAVRTMPNRIRSCLSTPLIADDRLVGVLSLYAKGTDSFSEDHQRLVEIVARQVSPVIQRSVQYASSSLREFRDPLTGLPNIQQLQRLASTQEQLLDLPQPTSLIYVDINQLKRVNATLGRNVGDYALHQVVQHLRTNLRAADVLFRLESDEFAILLFQTGRETANAIASRMKASVQQISLAGLRGHVNVTVGIATAPEDGVHIDSLVECARRRVGERSAGSGADSTSESTPGSIH